MAAAVISSNPLFSGVNIDIVTAAPKVSKPSEVESALSLASIPPVSKSLPETEASTGPPTEPSSGSRESPEETSPAADSGRIPDEKECVLPTAQEPSVELPAAQEPSVGPHPTRNQRRPIWKKLTSKRKLKLRRIVRAWLKSQRHTPKTSTAPPALTYAALIGESLLRSPNGRRSAKGICRYIMKNYEWYNMNKHSGWQAAISQELSRNSYFEAISVRRRGRSTETIQWSIASSRYGQLLQRMAGPDRTGMDAFGLPAFELPAEIIVCELDEAKDDPALATSSSPPQPHPVDATEFPYSWGVGYCSDSIYEIQLPISQGGIGARPFTYLSNLGTTPGPSRVPPDPLPFPPAPDSCPEFRPHRGDADDASIRPNPPLWSPVLPTDKGKGKMIDPAFNEVTGLESTSTATASSRNQSSQSRGESRAPSQNQRWYDMEGTDSSQSFPEGNQPGGKDDLPVNEEQGEGNNRKRKRVRTSEEEQNERKFACLYHKYDPQTYGINDRRYLVCAGQAHEFIAYVLRHLERKHDEYVCGKCLDSFDSKPSREAHTQNCRTRLNYSQEQKWAHLWRIRFPGVPLPSPYFEHAPSETRASRRNCGRAPERSLRSSVVTSSPLSHDHPVASRLESNQGSVAPTSTLATLVLNFRMLRLEDRVDILEKRLPQVEETSERLLHLIANNAEKGDTDTDSACSTPSPALFPIQDPEPSNKSRNNSPRFSLSDQSCGENLPGDTMVQTLASSPNGKTDNLLSPSPANTLAGLLPCPGSESQLEQGFLQPLTPLLAATWSPWDFKYPFDEAGFEDFHHIMTNTDTVDPKCLRTQEPADAGPDTLMEILNLGTPLSTQTELVAPNRETSEAIPANIGCGAAAPPVFHTIQTELKDVPMTNDSGCGSDSGFSSLLDLANDELHPALSEESVHDTSSGDSAMAI